LGRSTFALGIRQGRRRTSFTRTIDGAIALAYLLTIAALLFLFGFIAVDVATRKPSGFDRRIIFALRKSAQQPIPIGPPWLQEAARDVTSLGSVAVLLIMTFAVAGYLLLDRKPGVAWLMLIAVLGGLALNNLLKFVFARPRPEVVSPAPRVFTTSFPSGHATLSAITYLTIAALLARAYPSPILDFYFMSLAALLTVLIGLSRIYLGVHFPTDILGGWCIGTAWAIGCWVLLAWLQQGGQLESAGLM
jgi:undecaprenyl-diphosphatase